LFEDFEQDIDKLKEDWRAHEAREKEARQIAEEVTDEEPAKKMEIEAEQIVKAIIKGSQIISPQNGVIAETSANANQKGISFENGFGLVVTYPSALADSVTCLVSKDQQIKQGDPLFDVVRADLPKISLDVLNPGVVPGFESIPEKVIRIA
jgi:hypothetical protein